MARTGSAEVLPTHTPELFCTAVCRAAELLRAGEVVALPTETVYGLAANALNPDAVERIFSVKGRPSHNPIIVHVADIAMARRCVTDWPGIADRVASAFWPGPLTLVLPRSEEIPEIVTAGGSTVGVRWPSHPFMQAVIRECNFPIAAPSANRSNEISPTNAAHVQRAIGDKIRLIVDGGQSQIGIESTVLDLTVKPPRVLRPGMIHSESLLTVTEIGSFATGTEAARRKSPGLLPKHYAPKAKLVIWSWESDASLRQKLAMQAVNPATVHIVCHTEVPNPTGFGGVSVIPHDAEAFGRAIYAELHRCDEEGAELIVVEAVPDTALWQAISDRLRRASSE